MDVAWAEEETINRWSESESRGRAGKFSFSF